MSCAYLGSTLDARYEVQALLGQGQFAQVLLASDSLAERAKVAIKAPKDITQSRESFEAELEFLTICAEKASHQRNAYQSSLGVLLLRRVFRLDRARTCFVFDVVSCDLLQVHKQHPAGLAIPAFCCVAKDVARGLRFLHDECGILHMDIKLENIGVLMSEQSPSSSIERIEHDHGHGFGGDSPSGLKTAPSFGPMPSFGGDASGFGDDAPAFGAPAFGGPSFGRSAPAGPKSLDLSVSQLCLQSTRFCLFDFGNATWEEPSKQAAVEQTVTYRSPEVALQMRPRRSAADMWSLGCMLWELACGRRFYEPTHEDMTADGSRHQRLAQVARIQAILQEPLPEPLSRAQQAMGGPMLPGFPPIDARQRASHISQLLRASQPSSSATEASGFLADILVLDPTQRATAAEALEAATELEEISGARRASRGVVDEVDELDLALSPVSS
jgi:serine/threonine-protein kinase SRPK3